MRPRVGHGPFCLAWPWVVWKQIFYAARPDLVNNKTRTPQWRQLQSQWRFFHALFCFFGPPSHVLWNIKFPWLLIMGLAGWVNWWHVHATSNNMPIVWDRHEFLKDTFRLTSFAMALLLAFRVNRTYDRWREARSSLSGVGTGATSLFMQAATWVKDEELVEDFRRWTILWPYSIMQVVTGAPGLAPVAAALLHPSEMAVYEGSRKGRQVVVTMIRKLVEEADLPLEKLQAMEDVVQATVKSSGDALRVRFQAMPTGVSMMCTGFVLIWCLLLPLGLVVETGHNAWISLVAVSVASVLLLGCDEVANQMEEPFKLIPCEDIVSTYERDINRVRSELAALKLANEQARCSREMDRLQGRGAGCCPCPRPPLGTKSCAVASPPQARMSLAGAGGMKASAYTDHHQLKRRGLDISHEQPGVTGMLKRVCLMGLSGTVSESPWSSFSTSDDADGVMLAVGAEEEEGSGGTPRKGENMV